MKPRFNYCVGRDGTGQRQGPVGMELSCQPSQSQYECLRAGATRRAAAAAAAAALCV